MARVIAHAGHLLDDARDARQRPQIRLESMRPRAAAQRAVEAPELSLIEPGLPASPTGSPQASGSVAPPLAIPSRDTLAADVQLSGDGGQDQLAAGEQPRSLPAPLLQCLKITSRGNIAVHAPIIRTAAALVTLLCEAQ